MKHQALWKSQYAYYVTPYLLHGGTSPPKYESTAAADIQAELLAEWYLEIGDFREGEGETVSRHFSAQELADYFSPVLFYPARSSGSEVSFSSLRSAFLFFDERERFVVFLGL